MPEHQEIEWKESWRDEYLKWLCGYANPGAGGRSSLHPGCVLTEPVEHRFLLSDYG